MWRSLAEICAMLAGICLMVESPWTSVGGFMLPWTDFCASRTNITPLLPNVFLFLAAVCLILSKPIAILTDVSGGFVTQFVAR
jgi:hypothetical protein